MNEIIRSPHVRVGAAASIASLGLIISAFGALWVAGSLGISVSAATQIVAAITAGGWALRATILVFGAGVISAIAATVVMLVSVKGKKAAAL